jgi:branched-chain amino acid transport system ATP-binding protein
MLEVAGLTGGYGSAQILNGVDLTVRERDILVLLGRNGVGKTTLMRALIGLVAPTSGKIELNGQDIRGFRPNRIARAGIGYAPQGRGIFPKLTVRENLLVGTRSRRSGDSDIPKEIFGYFPILKERLSQLGGTLSGGQQQMLAIARALCGEPSILLLDEPSEGIQPSIVQQFSEVIRNIVGHSGISVLLVEQNLDLGLGVATRCAIMEKGRIVREGHPDEFRDEEVLRSYLAI